MGKKDLPPVDTPWEINLPEKFLHQVDFWNKIFFNPFVFSAIDAAKKMVVTSHPNAVTAAEASFLGAVDRKIKLLLQNNRSLIV